jgi:glutamate dehydrogenase/leucine dehydrogenase
LARARGGSGDPSPLTALGVETAIRATCERAFGDVAERAILWAPDFVANAGGLINIACEQGGYDRAVARRRVRAIAATLHQIFDRAEADGSTPLAAALALARARLVPPVSSVAQTA